MTAGRNFHLGDLVRKKKIKHAYFYSKNLGNDLGSELDSSGNRKCISRVKIVLKHCKVLVFSCNVLVTKLMKDLF